MRIRAPGIDHLQEKTGKILTDRLQYSSDSYFATLQTMFAIMSQPKSRPFLNLMLVESPAFPLAPSALKELLTLSSLKTFKLDQTFKCGAGSPVQSCQINHFRNLPLSHLGTELTGKTYI